MPSSPLRLLRVRPLLVALLVVSTGGGVALASSLGSAYAPVQRTNIDAAPAGSTLLPNGRLVTPAGTQHLQGDFPLGLAVSPDGRLAVATGVGQGDGTPGSDFAGFCRGGKNVKEDGCYRDGRFGPAPTTGPDEGLFVTDLVTGARTQLRGPATSCAPAADPAKSAKFSCFEDGVVFSPDGAHVYAAGGGNDAVYDYAVTPSANGPQVGPQPAKVAFLQQVNGAPASRGDYKSPNPGTTASRTKGLAATPDGKYLLVLKEQAGAMDILRTDTLAFVQEVSFGALNPAGANGSASYPYAVAVAGDGSAAYVTLQGLGLLATVPLTTATGTLVAGAPVGVAVGANPTAVAASPAAGTTPAGRTLLVAGANDDTITVLSTSAGTATPQVVQTLVVHALPNEQLGSVPNAIAFSGPDRAYVALAGDDALSVLDRGATGFTQSGLLPTGWYPTGVAVRPGGGVVALSAKGLGSGYSGDGSTPAQAVGGPQALNPGFYDASNLPGLLTDLPAPSGSDLTDGTAAVIRNLQYATAADPKRSGTVIPASDDLAGQSAIKHVVYIVRENRTYDQVFGDLARTRNDADADPAYESLGAATPNAHAVTGRYASSDSFFSDAEASVQGHYWTTSANTSDYVEKSYRQYYSDRSHTADEISAPPAFPKNCSIFQAAQRKAMADPSFTYTDFGDPVGAFNPQVPAAPGLGLPAGTPAGTVPNPCAALPAQVNPSSFSSFLGVDDRRFASEFLTQSGLNPDGTPINGAGANQQLRNFSYLELPGDHTTGFTNQGPTNVDGHTPRAQVAENDAAVGTVISALSKSSYWDSTAVFVVEDDSQDAPDHVDGHRNILLVASPYARQRSANGCYPGYISHVRSDQAGVLRTIELILGLPALSSYDQNASPLYDAFQNKSTRAQLDPADLSPFVPPAPAPFVEEKVGDATAGNPSQQAALRAQSAPLDLRSIDRGGAGLETVLGDSLRVATPGAAQPAGAPAQLTAADCAPTVVAGAGASTPAAPATGTGGPSTSPSGAAGSPGATPSSSAPAAGPTASGSAAVPLRVALSAPRLVAGSSAGVTVTGSPGASIELMGYTRPTTRYGVVRRASVGPDGRASFTITPPGNTRLYARYAGRTGTDSLSVVEHVAASVSLTARRTGPRTLLFGGNHLPDRAGQLITVYRRDGRGQVAVSRTRTGRGHTWSLSRTFSGTGRFTFVAAIGRTDSNDAGRSADRTATVR